ncbi:nSTAND1 domain-containing NTPase [Streptomyces bluensis]|uniref:nSTAND1 domain-containing NTPase n=1 Tax=Streptomyces bluensis TaxID=33897 RepID=UPI003EBEC27B
MVTPGDGVPDTRRPTDHAELQGDSGEAREVLERLARARLITLDGPTADAHEALITAWPRAARLDRRGEAAPADPPTADRGRRTWERLHQDAGALYRGVVPGRPARRGRRSLRPRPPGRRSHPHRTALPRRKPRSPSKRPPPVPARAHRRHRRAVPRS